MSKTRHRPQIYPVFCRLMSPEITALLLPTSQKWDYLTFFGYYCCCCPHINSHYQVRGHRTGSTLELRNILGKNTSNPRWYTHISQLTQFMPPAETHKSEIGSQSTVCQVYTWCIRLITCAWKKRLYRLPPKKDYHVCIKRSIYHYAYARQTKVKWKKKTRTNKKRKERKENRRKRKKKSKKEKQEKQEKKRQEKQEKARQEEKARKGKDKKKVTLADPRN